MSIAKQNKIRTTENPSRISLDCDGKKIHPVCNNITEKKKKKR